ncbi:hypothetical protein GGR51DRAFT_576523 [Nemania sp. FL0031]|nr:hypothetical protein GGR51DRAFT_576523 [Nemania sp. FL0031]
MFDVIWTDPNVELVGQRMLRKEQEAKEKDQKKRESGRQSVSNSSVSSASERGFSLFPSKTRRKTPTPSKGNPSFGAPSSEDPEREDAKAHRTSAYGVRAALSRQDKSEIQPKSSDGLFLPTKHFESDEARSPSRRDSVLSKWAQQAAMTGAFDLIETNNSVPESSTESYLQTLGPSSFITRTIDTASSQRTEEDTDEPKIETHVSSDTTKPQTPPSTEAPEDPITEVFEELGAFPIPGIRPKTPPPNGYQSDQVSASPKYQSYDHLANPEAWKPPHEWDCTPTKQATAATIDERLQVSPPRPAANNSMFPAFAALQRERRMMAAASTELMLTNLKSTMGEGADASVYKELEMTKKRWLFSALHQQGGYAQLIERSDERPETPTQPKQNRILALHETHASTSFIAALYPSVSITHLSPNPLSPDLLPNIRPLFVPSISVSASSRALPPRLYSAVTCLSMPALFPSTDIPPFLRHINRCLAPGGALHLTIIDPQPVSASMGPKLRQWLFTSLLINLEQAFRTTLPSETFPAWLAVANLRGKGSTIAVITAPAITKISSKEDAKIELRCLVNRLLWQEVWGRFVTASRWWWEEEEIVQECFELGTHWQYSHIIAVKGDN